MGSTGTISNNTSSYGTLVHTYKDGTKGYEKPNTRMSREEEIDQYKLMDNVIIQDFAKQFNVRESDIEYDRETGNITLWRDATDYEKARGAIGGKSFYKTEVYGTKHTSVRKDGSISTYYSNSSYKFKHTGGKF